MYLPQAVPRPPSLGIEWDLFRHNQLVEEVQLEPAVVTCSVAVRLVPVDRRLLLCIENNWQTF